MRMRWFLTLCLFARLGVTAGEPAPDAVRKALPVERGLVVHAGADGPELGIALATDMPLVVHVLLRDASAEAAARARLATAGLHGQVTVARWQDAKRLPFLDDTATAVVADLDARKGLRFEECLRAVRPGGIAYVKRGGAWTATPKERPDDVDDWPEYAHDAAATDVSSDERVGPARGLQWQTGPEDVTKDGIRLVGGIWLACESERRERVYGGERKRLVARDAYSGLPLWQRDDLLVNSRFAFLADRERVYLNPDRDRFGWPAPCMIALDLRTGETVAKFEEGITFQQPAELPKDRKEQEGIKRMLQAGSQNIHARLSDGVLLQMAAQDLVALDAASGKRLWAKHVAGDFETDHTLALKGAVWMHPAVRDGVVYVIQGTGCRSFSYTHWPASTVDRILAFDLKTGQERWANQWAAEKGEPIVAYNLTCAEGVLALAVRAGETSRTGKGQLRLLLLDAKTGKTLSLQETGKGRKEIGGGHSHARALVNRGKVWVSTIYGASCIDLADPVNRIDKAYDGLRPVGCTVWRATPKWHIGSLTVAALDGSGYYWTDAHRTVCDVGAFPANGLLYITPNHCGCQPYQPGSNATHSRLLKEDATLERLERGSAKPAGPKGEGGWATLLRDNLRSAWSDEKLGRELAVAWQTKVSAAPAKDAMLQREWDNHYYTNGPVTAASVAEGVCVLAVPHRQEVVALDAGTGKETWRIAVDGRAESQPTIHRGLVLFGTRCGWVYAVNRDTGETVWRFLAAPSAERIVVDGQLESVWPVFGSVVVEGDDVWAFAGRHSDLDGGVGWWRLNLAGDVQAKGRLGYEELRRDAKEERPIRMANMPPVFDGKRFYFAQQYLERQGDALVPWDEGQGRTGHEWDNWAARAKMNAMIPANTGTLQDGRRERALNANSHYYGGTRARQFCYRGDDYISLYGTLEKGNRGGNAAAAILRMRRLGPDEESPRKGVAAVPVWKGVRITNWIGRNGYKACAVAGDRVLVGWSMEGSDSHSYKEPRHKVDVLDYETGKMVQSLPVPAPILYAGIAVAHGAAYAVSEDGTVSCMK